MAGVVDVADRRRNEFQIMNLKKRVELFQREQLENSMEIWNQNLRSCDV